MAEPKRTEGLGALEAKIEAGERQAEIERLKTMPGYTVKSALEVLKANPVPPTEIWGGICLGNDVCEIIGASGIGKSRIMLNLAVRQCLADTIPDFDENGEPILCEFAGNPLYKGPVRWLLLGTENSLYRYHSDLRGMTRHCSEEQLRILGERLFMTTLESDGDTFMAVDGLASGDGNGNFEKLRATIAKVMPDIIVLDPWGDIIGGSELDDKVVRETVATLRLLRQGVMDRLTIVVVNHSRMGESENVKAIGLDGANFGKNSKALFTISRSVWNLAYLEDDLSAKVIACINAKRSNGRPFKAMAVRFDEDTMSYETDWNIDVEQRMRDMSYKTSQPSQNGSDVRASSFRNETDAAVEKAIELMKDGVVSKSYIEVAVKRAGSSVRNVEDVFTILETERGIKRASDPFEKNKTYYGKPEHIAAFQDEIARRQADKKAAEDAAKAQKEAEKAAKRAEKTEAKSAKNPGKRGRKPKK